MIKQAVPLKIGRLSLHFTRYEDTAPPALSHTSTAFTLDRKSQSGQLDHVRIELENMLRSELSQKENLLLTNIVADTKTHLSASSDLFKTQAKLKEKYGAIKLAGPSHEPSEGDASTTQQSEESLNRIADRNNKAHQLVELKQFLDPKNQPNPNKTHTTDAGRMSFIVTRFSDQQQAPAPTANADFLLQVNQDYLSTPKRDFTMDTVRLEVLGASAADMNTEERAEYDDYYDHIHEAIQFHERKTQAKASWHNKELDYRYSGKDQQLFALYDPKLDVEGKGFHGYCEKDLDRIERQNSYDAGRIRSHISEVAANERRREEKREALDKKVEANENSWRQEQGLSDSGEIVKNHIGIAFVYSEKGSIEITHYKDDQKPAFMHPEYSKPDQAFQFNRRGADGETQDHIRVEFRNKDGAELERQSVDDILSTVKRHAQHETIDHRLLRDDCKLVLANEKSADQPLPKNNDKDEVPFSADLDRAYEESEDQQEPELDQETAERSDDELEIH